MNSPTNPVNVFPDSVYGGGGDKLIEFLYQPDNPQSTINLPEGGRVRMRIIFSEAAGTAKIDLLLRQPTSQTIMEYANRNIGYTWVSEDYPPNSNVEFGIYWYYNHWGTIYEGNEAGAVIMQLSSDKYQIGFEAAGDDWDYNELVIEVTIENWLPEIVIEPPSIKTGQTALVTVKKQFYDGRIEDFQPGQLFEFGMMEGCAAGVLVSGEDTATYFFGVTQPILFIAADSLENEEETVLIGVGVIEGSQQTRMNKGFSEFSYGEKTKDDEELKNTDWIIIEYCFNGDFTTSKRSEGSVLVKKDGCDNLPTEHQEINYMLLEQPEFFKVPHSDEEELKMIELIQVCNDDAHPNQNGGSIPVDYKRYRYDYNTNSFKNSWMLEPYKGIDDKVHYNFINPETNQPASLIFDFVTGVCSLKINPAGHPPKTFIDNLADVGDPNKIPSNDYEQAFFDFCGHLCYPNERAVYVLTEIIRLHEREHMNDFAEEVASNFPNLVQAIEGYSDLCDSYSETVRKNAEKVIYDMIFDFIQEAIEDYQKMSGVPGSNEERLHERGIQRRPSITNRIEEYKDDLRMRFSQLVGRNCQNCSYE